MTKKAPSVDNNSSADTSPALPEAGFWARWRGRELFAGFSGGADSTAALLLTLRAAADFDIRVTAVHFDHGLRGAESAAEAEKAAAFAAGHHIPFRRIDLHLDPAAGDLENRARQARLQCWRELTAASPGSAVILGHHADDRVESLFLRLARGSNVSGLVSPRRISEVGGVTFIRPLLDWSRREVEEFLRKAGVTCWAEDSSNRCNDFSRNYLRNRLLPEFYQRIPGSREGLYRAVSALEADADYLESEAARLAALPESGKAEFWRQLHPALAIRVLRHLCGGVIPPPEALQRLREEVERPDSGEPRQIPVADGTVLLLQKGILMPLPPPPPSDIIWERRQKKTALWNGWELEIAASCGSSVSGLDEAVFDACSLPDELFVTAPRPGDVIVPFGGTLPVKLKKARTDRKVPSIPVLPVLRDGSGTILWAPFIRHSCHHTALSGGKSVRIRIFRPKNDC